MLLAVLKAAFEYMPPWMKQKVCAWIAPGHGYSMEMIRMEDNSYVLDPFVQCRHCQLPLPESIYTQLIAEIDSDDAEDEIEDEVW